MKKRKAAATEAIETHGKRRFRPLYVYMVIALCLAVFVVLNMIVIFLFSSESKEESGHRSTGITSAVVRILYPDYEERSYNEKLEIMESTHTVIRKLAHFSEFGLLGFLSTGLLLYLNHRKRKLKIWMTWVFPAVFCLLYAIFDEVHQIFSERGPSVKDVLIDFSGAVLGLCLIQLTVWMCRRSRTRRNMKKCKPRATA